MTASAASSSVRTPRRAGSPSRRRRKITLAGPVLGRDQAVLVGRSIVQCPYNGNDRITVSVNRRVDVLAQERSANRIGEDHFQVGRHIQAVFERGSGARLGSSGWDIAGSHDQTIAHELAILYAIDDAEKVKAFTAEMTKSIGSVGVRFLRAILADGQTFGVYAVRTGKGSSERAATDIAKRFRWLLEEVTENLHTARGAEGQRIRATREVTSP